MAGEGERMFKSLSGTLKGFSKTELFKWRVVTPIWDPVTECRACENSGNSKRFLNEHGPKFN